MGWTGLVPGLVPRCFCGFIGNLEAPRSLSHSLSLSLSRSLPLHPDGLAALMFSAHASPMFLHTAWFRFFRALS